LKKEMPAMMGKQKAQKRLMENLEDEFAKVPVLTYSWPTYIQSSSAFALLWDKVFSYVLLFS
jgi:hypothetical protein